MCCSFVLSREWRDGPICRLHSSIALYIYSLKSGLHNLAIKQLDGPTGARRTPSFTQGLLQTRFVILSTVVISFYFGQFFNISSKALSISLAYLGKVCLFFMPLYAKDCSLLLYTRKLLISRFYFYMHSTIIPLKVFCIVTAEAVCGI
jgi:hypothetical protein